MADDQAIAMAAAIAVADPTRCPCGSPVGPDFRYGLCDACARSTPGSTLIRMGNLHGAIALLEKNRDEYKRLLLESDERAERLLKLAQRLELERDAARKALRNLRGFASVLWERSRKKFLAAIDDGIGTPL